METAALAEGYSNHPIANSIREAYGRELDLSRVDQTTEIAGHGIAVLVDGRKVLVGNEKLMKKEGIDFVPDDHVGTVVYVAKEGRFLGSVCISDTVKEGAREAISPDEGGRREKMYHAYGRQRRGGSRCGTETRTG